MNAHRKFHTAARHLRLLPLLIGCAFTSAGALAADPEPDQLVPGRILVQPNPGLPEAELEKILNAHGGKSIGKIEAIDVHVVQLPENASEKAVAALLSKNKHLKFAEPDRLVKLAATANDPYYGSAWHLSKMGVQTAWDSTNGNGVVIAVLDSGVDASHPDLAGKLVAGWNFYDNNSSTADVYGHGTKVAGAAAATTNNAAGVSAVAGGAKIMPVRVTNTSGYGSLTAIASGLTWAADHGARLANLSFYGVSASSSITSAAQYMKNKGGLVTVSAGNYGTEATYASTDTMIIVSATDGADAKASWSSYGSYVDVAAPGSGIWTTSKGGGYGSVNGTSFSAPVTAGVLALMMAANPALAPSQLQQMLFSTAKDLGTAGKDKYFGYGRINASAAVAAAKGSGGGDTAAPSVSLTSPSGGTTAKGLVTVSASASDNVGVSRVELTANGTVVASDITAPYSFTWDSTKVADGNATLKAIAYDAAGNYSSSSVAVTVANNADTVASSTTTHVSNIAMSLGTKTGGYARARAIITVVDAAGKPVSGAKVSGSWSGLVTGSSAGTTSTTGTVSLDSAYTTKSGTFTFTVTGVSVAGYTYSAAASTETTDSITR